MKLPGLLVLLVSLLLPARPAPGDGQPFVLGVLRRDGVVSPFAAFNGKHWSAPWPVTLRYLELPFSVEAVPGKWWGKAGTPSEMTIWTDGTNRGAVRLERPIPLQPMCSTRLALRTSYKSPHPAPLPMDRPYPKDGLAITGTQPIDAIEILTPSAPEWIPTALLLMDPFARAEQGAIRAFTEWKHPLSGDQRASVPLELETMYRAPMDEPGWTAYHLEAVKRYPPGPNDEGCGPMTSVSAWMRVGPEGKRSIRTYRADVTYCERAGSSFMLPLGLIKTGGRHYWVYQISGHNREYYVVARPLIDSLESMVDYEAGVCPSRSI